MAAQKDTIEKYLTALMVLRHKLNTGQPVTKTAFIKEWRLTSNLFTYLRDMNILSEDDNAMVWIGAAPNADQVIGILDMQHQAYSASTKPKPATPTLDDISKQLDARLARIERILENFVA